MKLRNSPSTQYSETSGFVSASYNSRHCIGRLFGVERWSSRIQTSLFASLEPADSLRLFPHSSAHPSPHHRNRQWNLAVATYQSTWFDWQPIDFPQRLPASRIAEFIDALYEQVCEFLTEPNFWLFKSLGELKDVSPSHLKWRSLTVLDSMTHLTSLQHLNLAYNHLKHLRTASLPPNLISLDVSFNDLLIDAFDIAQLESMRILSFLVVNKYTLDAEWIFRAIQWRCKKELSIF